ncbi:hypothetical protein LMG28614_04438 [Paraburkholderia ultramafica]|uniref:Uncharacterized protein n=1 Tax=Paraburkholderia ultramafica TaxID=1544867 RepID=A0A6S7D5S3_9BURK|nr:hypothetical protein LMG28614_04438 [Paraburkholderia ultramafica]
MQQALSEAPQPSYRGFPVTRADHAGAFRTV